MKPFPIVVGFDQREAVAYHVFCQSVLEKASVPVQFTPLAINSLRFYSETHTDGSNRFIYSRFLTPCLRGYEGPAIFADGDMVCMTDIAELIDLYDPNLAVQVVQHDYKTKASIKYLGNKNQDYPRKNWSSLILWNCGHPANQVLTPAFVQQQPGSYLHRFSWLQDNQIGALPAVWNWLATEYEDNPQARLIHYTLGTPCFKDFQQSAMAASWHATYFRILEGINAA
jgi:hypothetical protein